MARMCCKAVRIKKCYFVLLLTGNFSCWINREVACEGNLQTVVTDSDQALRLGRLIKVRVKEYYGSYFLLPVQPSVSDSRIR
jgi:hypothetical protein